MNIYFTKASGTKKNEIENKGFELVEISNKDFPVLYKLKESKEKSKIEFHTTQQKEVQIEIHQDSPFGNLLANCVMKERDENITSIALPALQNIENSCFVFNGKGEDLIRMDSFLFK